MTQVYQVEQVDDSSRWTISLRWPIWVRWGISPGGQVDRLL